MAQFTFTNNTYAGEALAGFMASTLLEADSVKRDLITVIDNCKARKILLDVDDDVVLQNPSGRFNDQGTTSLQNETYIDPVVYEFMKEEQWDKLVQSWENKSIKPGAMQDYDGVVDLSDFMVERYQAKIQIANEKLYWIGKSNTKEATFTAAYPGLINKISASGSGAYKVNLSTKALTSDSSTAISASGVVTVADTTKYQDGDVVSVYVTAGALAETTHNVGGVALLNTLQSYYIAILSATTFKLVRNYNDINARVPATFTGTATAATLSYVNVSNVIQVLGWIYSQLDPADRTQDDFHLQIPLHVGYAYAQAQANKATNVLNAFTDVKTMDYLGIKLELMNWWFANTFIGARASNLFLGVDLLSDSSNLETRNLGQYTLDNVVRMKARMKSDTNFKFGNEIFITAPQLVA